MKKALILALVATFVLGAAGLASAKEVTMQGQFEMNFQWSDNLNYFDTEGDGQSEDDFKAFQRVRAYFNYVENENLSGTFALEWNTNWGDPATGGQLTTDATTTTRFKRGYIDFNWPDTALHLRVGLQGLAFPAAVAGSPIWDDDVAGIVASYAVNDNLSIVAGWARLYDRNIDDDTTDGNNSSNDEIDAFTVIAPITMDGWSLTPYFIYANHGQQAAGNPGGLARTGLLSTNGSNLTDDADIFWVGGAFELTAFDPLVIKSDLIYGMVNADNSTNDKAGWFFDVAAMYKMDFGTPGAFFMYSTGEDDDATDGSEKFPTLGGAYGPTSFGTDGSVTWTGADQQLDDGGTDYGFWIFGLGLYDVASLENMKHTIRVAYGQGTTDNDLVKKLGANLTRGGDAVIVTDKDSFWEVNIDTSYALYENLTAYLELGYISLDLDEDVHTYVNTDKIENAYKALFSLKYNF